MSGPPKKRKTSVGVTAVVTGVALTALVYSQQVQGDDRENGPVQESNRESITATVKSVSDGDTIRVLLEGESETERVRILGLDAPEVHTSRDCGGEESWHNLETLLTPGDKIRLIPDPSQSFYDQYDRILAYVEDAAGVDVGLAQIESGWARVYRKGSHIELFDEYVKAESVAKSKNAGMWELC